jgi:hypothetical protein
MAAPDWNSLDARRGQPATQKLGNALARLRSGGALREIKAHALPAGSSERLMNVVQGLATTLSIGVPRVLVYRGDANALVAR